MELTPLQTELLRLLRLAVNGKQGARVVYHTEWLGYLPFGLYRWINDADGEDISNAFPSEWCLDWSQRDLEALEKAGYLSKIDEWDNANDDCETTTTYEFVEPGA